jgi:polysaccharide lyase-like protein
MTVFFSSGFIARRGALAAVTSLLLAAGCSAPPGADGDDDGLPEFGGAQTPAPGAGGSLSAVATPSTGAPGTGAVTPAPTGVTPNEQTGNGGIGLAPAPAGGQSGSQSGASQGAGGSAMVAPGGGGAGGAAMVAPGTGAGGSAMVAPGTGAGGSAMVAPGGGGAGGSSFEPAGAGGATSLPPNDGNQQPPPNDGNQQPPPEPVAPAPSGDCNGAFFCDGFESVAAGASPDAALWSIMVQYGETSASPNVQVSAANARSGNQALRVEPAGRAGIFTSVPQNSYFIRAFMQIDEVAIGPVFIGAGTDGNREIRFRIQGQSFATINSVGSPSDDAVRPAEANGGNCPDCLTLTPNEWLCVEMAVDSNSSTATLWIDGAEAAVAGPDAFSPQPANPTLFFGSMDVQGGSTGVWIDDIAVGATRIGCN